MSEYKVDISWENSSGEMDYDRYDRNHSWRFSGGVTLTGSAAPEFNGDSSRVDPEAALVASLSSCHMLTFLALAARRRLVVAAYCDTAVGYLEPLPSGHLAMTRVKLKPKVTFAAGTDISPDQFKKLHDRAHEECFIANSVKTDITVDATIE